MLNKQITKTLELDSSRCLESILFLEERLIDETIGTDRSLLLIGYFKIIEIELYNKLFLPFREHYEKWRKQGGKQPATSDFFSLKHFISDEEMTEIEGMTSFLNGGKHLTLGNMAATLKHIGDVPGVPTTHFLALLKMFIKARFDRGYYLYGKSRLGERIYSAALNHRNPAVHSTLYNAIEYEPVAQELLGSTNERGIINLLLKGLIPK